MKCPKCSRNSPDDKKACMYCGESLDDRTVPEDDPTVTDDNNIPVQSEDIWKDIDEPETPALPDTMELTHENIPHEDPEIETPHQDTMITNDSLDDDILIETLTELPLDRALNLLKGFKESFDRSQIKTAEYQKLVMEVIKDYISPMDDKTKINFVANDIKESELYKYLNDEIYKSLRTFVIEEIANK